MRLRVSSFLYVVAHGRSRALDRLDKSRLVLARTHTRDRRFLYFSISDEHTACARARATSTHAGNTTTSRHHQPTKPTSHTAAPNQQRTHSPSPSARWRDLSEWIVSWSQTRQTYNVPHPGHERTCGHVHILCKFHTDTYARCALAESFPVEHKHHHHHHHTHHRVHACAYISSSYFFWNRACARVAIVRSSCCVCTQSLHTPRGGCVDALLSGNDSRQTAQQHRRNRTTRKTHTQIAGERRRKSLCKATCLWCTRDVPIDVHSVTQARALIPSHTSIIVCVQSRARVSPNDMRAQSTPAT